MDLVIVGCEQRHPPTATHECLAAIWTQGQSCKTCWVSCYRQGWSAAEATHDNVRLVFRPAVNQHGQQRIATIAEAHGFAPVLPEQQQRHQEEETP